MVEQTVARFGRLDAAFNNAGTEGAWGSVGELTVEDFDATIGVNLRGVWLCCQAEMVQMQRQGHGGAPHLLVPDNTKAGVIREKARNKPHTASSKFHR